MSCDLILTGLLRDCFVPRLLFRRFLATLCLRLSAELFSDSPFTGTRDFGCRNGTSTLYSLSPSASPALPLVPGECAGPQKKGEPPPSPLPTHYSPLVAPRPAEEQCVCVRVCVCVCVYACVCSYWFWGEVKVGESIQFQEEPVPECLNLLMFLSHSLTGGLTLLLYQGQHESVYVALTETDCCLLNILLLINLRQAPLTPLLVQRSRPLVVIWLLNWLHFSLHIIPCLYRSKFVNSDPNLSGGSPGPGFSV